MDLNILLQDGIQHNFRLVKKLDLQASNSSRSFSQNFQLADWSYSYKVLFEKTKIITNRVYLVHRIINNPAQEIIILSL